MCWDFEISSDEIRRVGSPDRQQNIKGEVGICGTWGKMKHPSIFA
jgi:hypothetical protein